MNVKYFLSIAIATAALVVFGAQAISAQDKYTVKVPGGLSLSEVRGYESWEVISVSTSDHATAVILGNPMMIDAFKAGIPDNGKPFPDGAKMVKVHWLPKKSAYFPTTTVPGSQHDVDVMVKDSKRFPDSNGWGYAYIKYDAASDTFSPATTEDTPPQANDAKCGAACHTIVKARDYVFTEYGHR